MGQVQARFLTSALAALFFCPAPASADNPFTCQMLESAAGKDPGAIPRDYVVGCQEQIDNAVQRRPADVLNAPNAEAAELFAFKIRDLWAIVARIEKKTGIDFRFPEEKVKEVERLAAQRRVEASRIPAGAGRRVPEERGEEGGNSLKREVEAAVKSGDYRKAEALLDRAIEASPGDAEALSYRAMIRLEQRQLSQAAADAAAALGIDPRNALAARVLGEVKSMERAEGAGSVRVSRPAFDRRDADGGGFLGPERPAEAAKPGTASPGEAAAPGRALPGLAPPSPSDPFIQNAGNKIKIGDLSGALLEATRAIHADKRNPRGWILRAVIGNRAKNPEAALLDAEEALKLEPENIEALIERGYSRFQLARYGEALEDLSKAIGLDPRNALAYLYRAMTLEKLLRGREALADYEAAARLDPSLKLLRDEAAARMTGKPAGSASASGARAWRRLTPLGLVALMAAALLLVDLKILSRRPAAAAAETPEAPGSLPAPKPPESAGGGLLAGVFRVERELGRGGMGVVYEATDSVLKRRVALKRLNRDAGADPQARQRFVREAQLAVKLRHPNLAEIFSVAQDGDDLYLVFELVEGETLHDRLARRKRLPAAEVLGLLRELCPALEYAHGQKVIHRDLKPSNVMIAGSGRLKVMDFGIAHEARSSTAFTQTAAWGTPPYMAPEQSMGSVSKASDLYALAVMTYELLTGRLPFPGPDFLEPKLRKEFPPLSSLDPSLGAVLDGFFAKALEPDPTRRHSTAAEFLSAFESAV